MTDILVRNISADTLRRLKLRAERHGRSLQMEVKSVLEESARRLSEDEFWSRVDQIRAQLVDRHFGDSTPLIREDRDR